MAVPPKKKWGKKVLTALCVVLSIILLLCLVALIYINSWLDKIQRPGEQGVLSSSELQALEQETDPVDENFTGPVLDPLEITWGTAPTRLVGTDENIINILLIGQDRQPGQGRQRSDSMILCTINREKKTVTMTSFMRDLYVQIPGYSANRLNAAYAINGMTLLDKSLEVNFGIHVDGNVEVDFSGFQEIIDLIGGIDIELSEAEVRRLTNVGKYKGLTVGVNHLDGKLALSYSRLRMIDSDFERTNRQRKVLTAVINKCKTMPYTRIMDVVEQCIGLVTTDMTNLEIMQYAVSLVPLMSKMDIVTQRIPADGTYRNASINGMYVLVPDLDANRQILIDTLAE